MVLVIIAMQPVATHGLKILKSVQPILNDLQHSAVIFVVDGIGFWLPDDRAIHHACLGCQTESIELSGGKVDQLVISQGPKSVAGVAEILQSDACVPRIGHHVWRPRSEILDSPDFDLGIMNINPVVGKRITVVENQCDDQKVAVFELPRCVHDLLGRRRIDASNEIGKCHARDKFIGSYSKWSCRSIAAADHYRLDMVASANDSLDAAIQPDFAAALMNQIAPLLPHHSGPEAGIIKFLDQTGGVICSRDCVPDRFSQRQILDALCRPIRRDLRAWNAPDLFRVGPEEIMIEPSAKTIYDPLF